MRTLRLLPALTIAAPLLAQAADTRAPRPLYDFRDAHTLLDAELPNLSGHVAVLVHQNGRELFRYQFGDIDYDTVTPMASLTKTVSAAVILDCVEDGTLDLDTTLGAELPLLFGPIALGDATHLDCWSMRHGIDSAVAWEHSSLVDHAQSVVRISIGGTQQFVPGTFLDYDGSGMQVSGYVAALRTGLDWESLARERVLGPLGMDTTDYRRFDPNPAVAGGLRSTANEIARFTAMVLRGGTVRDRVLLEPSSIEALFTDNTAGLPNSNNPFPAWHPDYPYGQRPTYGFGDWVFATDPVTGHVEEVVGVGAWGSYLWIDRRRGLSAILVTDVPAGFQSSADAALGLMRVARQAVEERQVHGLAAAPLPNGNVGLTWDRPRGAGACIVYGSTERIENIYQLRTATELTRTTGSSAKVAPYAYYAVVADLAGHTNTALVPGSNSIAR